MSCHISLHDQIIIYTLHTIIYTLYTYFIKMISLTPISASYFHIKQFSMEILPNPLVDFPFILFDFCIILHCLDVLPIYSNILPFTAFSLFSSVCVCVLQYTCLYIDSCILHFYFHGTYSQEQDCTLKDRSISVQEKVVSLTF